MNLLDFYYPPFTWEINLPTNAGNQTVCPHCGRCPTCGQVVTQPSVPISVPSTS